MSLVRFRPRPPFLALAGRVEPKFAAWPASRGLCCFWGPLAKRPASSSGSPAASACPSKGHFWDRFWRPAEKSLRNSGCSGSLTATSHLASSAHSAPHAGLRTAKRRKWPKPDALQLATHLCYVRITRLERYLYPRKKYRVIRRGVLAFVAPVGVNSVWLCF